MVQGLCGAFHNSFRLCSPTLRFYSPPCSWTSLSFRLRFVTLQHCSLPSSGKIILTLSKPASLIGDRGGMNKGSKEPFFPPYCQVIFTLGPCGAAQCHTPITRSRLLSICGTWAAAFVPLLKPNHLVHMFSRLSKNKRGRPLKCKRKRFLLKNNKEEINP